MEPDAPSALLAQIDPQRLQVITALFPAPTSGVAFLARLLREAKGVPDARPLEASQDVAVVTVQSIRELARMIGWGYDTTHKYVVTFCALGLLTKRRVGGQIDLHIPLGRYTPPPSFDALDRLIAARRHKVQSFARKVKRRFLLLYGFRHRTAMGSTQEALADLDAARLAIQRLILHAPATLTHEDLAAVLTTLDQAQRRLGTHRPPLADESEGVELYADVVILMHREEMDADHTEHSGLADLIIAKNRYGPTGQITVRFDPTTAQFRDA